MLFGFQEIEGKLVTLKEEEERISQALGHHPLIKIGSCHLVFVGLTNCFCE